MPNIHQAHACLLLKLIALVAIPAFLLTLSRPAAGVVQNAARSDKVPRPSGAFAPSNAKTEDGEFIAVENFIPATRCALNGVGLDQLLRQTNTGSGSLYFLHDHLNSAIGLTTQTGSVAERLKYDAYGSYDLGAGSLLTRFDYTGRERDVVTGLMYYRAR